MATSFSLIKKNFFGFGFVIIPFYSVHFSIWTFKTRPIALNIHI
jgi:hypothetical protein